MTQIKIFYSRNQNPARELAALEEKINEWLSAHDTEILVVEIDICRDDHGSAILLLYEEYAEPVQED